MKRQLPIKRILVALWMNGTAGRDILSGVFDYARADRHLLIELLQLPNDVPKELLDRIRANGLDGVITSESAQPSVKYLLDMTDAPLVSVRPKRTPEDSSRRESSVGCNDLAIGECAAGHFLRLGRFRSYAFVGVAGGVAWSDERERGFRAALAASGEECSSVKFRDAVFLNHGEAAGFIGRLPKPAAVFAVYDGFGVQLLGLCRELSLAVPDQVSVIGVDNDELLCDFSDPPLTSIAPDHRRVGFLAARELDALMRSRNRVPRHIECSIKTVVERASVCAPTPSVTLVRRLLDHIRQHAADGTSIGDIVRRLGVSRRLADLRFREAEGTTILEAVTRRRMEIAEQLLRNPKLPISVVAARSGYRNVRSFLAAFKRLYGRTPSAWREAARRAGQTLRNTCLR